MRSTHSYAGSEDVLTPTFSCPPTALQAIMLGFSTHARLSPSSLDDILKYKAFMLQVGLDLAFYGTSHDLEPSKTVSIYSKLVQAYRMHYSYLLPVYTRALVESARREDGTRRTERRDRVPAQDLGDQGAHVGQLRAVVERREPVRADDGVELGLRALLDVRIERHGEEERRDRGDGLARRVRGAAERLQMRGSPCPRRLSRASPRPS